MTGIKISELPEAEALTDADLLEVIQSGESRRMSGSQLYMALAGDVAAERHAAEAEKNAAIVAKTAAEAARDAAIINSTMYATEALGRAAVADGTYFRVVGSGEVASYQYRRDSSSASTLIASYPSIAALTKLDAYRSLYKTSVWRHAWVDVARRVLLGLKPDGTVWAAKFYSLAATIKTLTVSALSATAATLNGKLIKTSRSGDFEIAVTTADGKSILGGLRRTGVWQFQALKSAVGWIDTLTVKVLAVSGLTLASTSAATKRICSRLALTAADGKTVLAQLDQDGYWYFRTRPIRRQTSAAGARWLAYTQQSGSIWLLIVQSIATGLCHTVYSGLYLEVSGVSGDDVLVRYTHGAIGTVSAIGPDRDKRLSPVADKTVGWGDSLTGGASPAGVLIEYHTRLKALIDAYTGRSTECTNLGVGGQTSRQIAWRTGGTPVAISVSGGVIPARTALATPVKVALTSWSFPPMGAQGWQEYTCWVNGVACRIYRNGSDASFSIAREHIGDAVTVADGSLCTCDPEAQWIADIRERVSFIWLGNNNATETSTVLADIAVCVSRLRTISQRYIVFTHVSPHPAGDSGVASRATNTAILAAYPQNCIDIRSVLMAHGDGSTTDNADITAGNTPSSLRVDGIHLSAVGMDIVAATIFQFLKDKGWV